MELKADIKAVAAEWPTYGYRRITAQLRRQEWRVNHKRVQRLPTSTPQPTPTANQLADEPEGESARKGLCPGSTAIGLVTLVGVVWARRRTSFPKEQR